VSENSDPTAILVHGAFADASGFAGIIRELRGADFVVVAPPNPLRGVATDASSIRGVAAAVDGPVVLVGHSYGGAVISQAAAGLDNVVRPWLIKRGANLPLVLIFAGVIGGLLAFGIIGLFIGPVVLTVAYTLLVAWVKEDLPARGAEEPAAKASV